MAPKILCVVGPTACGKTTLGVQLAKKFNGEVVSVDSMQIYKGMTIGTAAPTEAEMDGVPHHMIAVTEPEEQWSAARYTEMAVPIINNILSRGKLPILVGGTGLWLAYSSSLTGGGGGGHPGKCRGHCNGWFSVCFLAALPIKAENKGSFNKNKGENGFWLGKQQAETHVASRY